MLAAALTRAEMIDRMRASPATRLDGLVQVIGDCPADMRREYLQPVASFAAGVCTSLYETEKIEPRRFRLPGILIYLGDERTNRTDLAVRELRRESGAPYVSIRIPAPGFADLEALRRETAKAFYLAVKGERIDDAAAVKALRRADPELRLADEEAELQAWLDGRPVEGDDEKYLRMMRTVARPGRATTADVLRYGAVLRLHPPLHCAPFCGRFGSCTFREAIDLVKKDPRIRIQAFLKRSEVVAYACGRGEALASAATAYAAFLAALAENKTDGEKLKDMLEEADIRLNVAFEEARKAGQGTLK